MDATWEVNERETRTENGSSVSAINLAKRLALSFGLTGGSRKAKEGEKDKKLVWLNGGGKAGRALCGGRVKKAENRGRGHGFLISRRRRTGGVQQLNLLGKGIDEVL